MMMKTELFNSKAVILLLVMVGWTTVFAPHSEANIEVEKTIHLEPGQKLEDALAGVKGAVEVVLPSGVTEYECPITRTETTRIRGQGKTDSVLRAAANVMLVRQTETFDRRLMGRPDRRRTAEPEETDSYDGHLIFKDLTIDRANRPAPRFWDEEVDYGPLFFLTTARGVLRFENVRIQHFDFAKRPGLLMYARDRLEEIGFYNFTMDFQAGGGTANRPRREGSGRTANHIFNGDADYFIADADSEFIGETLSRPPRVEPENWGSITGLGGNVYKRGDIDATFREWDYGVWMKGGPATKDAVLAFRGDNLDAGFADQYWPRASVPDEVGGHIKWKGVTLTSAKNNVYHDYGFKTNTHDWLPGDGFASVTIRDCEIHGRGNPFATTGGGPIREMIIENVKVRAIKNGFRVRCPGVERLLVDGFDIAPTEDRAYYWFSLDIHGKEDWGDDLVVRNVTARGFLDRGVMISSPVEERVEVSGITEEPFEGVELDEGVELGIPPHSQSIIGRPDTGLYGLPYGSAPASFRTGESFVTAFGDPKTRDNARVLISWDSDFLYFHTQQPGQGNVPPQSESLQDGDIVRVGFAAVDEDSAYVIDVARTYEGDEEFARDTMGLHDDEGYASGHRAYLREYPGGEGRKVTIPIASRINQPWENFALDFAIPWELVGIEPGAGERFRFDIGIGDAHSDGERRGALQLFESSGLWDSEKGTDFEVVELLGPTYALVTDDPGDDG